jgi:hypothetical protein
MRAVFSKKEEEQIEGQRHVYMHITSFTSLRDLPIIIFFFRVIYKQFQEEGKKGVI